MKQLTTEQHLQNVWFAVKNAVGKHEETTAIRDSFNHIRKLLLEKKDDNKKEDIIKP